MPDCSSSSALVASRNSRSGAPSKLDPTSSRPALRFLSVNGMAASLRASRVALEPAEDRVGIAMWCAQCEPDEVEIGRGDRPHGGAVVGVVARLEHVGGVEREGDLPALCSLANGVQLGA